MARDFKIRRSKGRFHRNGRGFYRIRRSANRIIDPRRKLYTKIAAIAAGVLLLFAAGWFAYEPLVQALLHSGEQEQESSSEPVSEVSSEPESEPEEATNLFADPVLASTVPEEVFADDTRYAAFLAGLGDDVNAVVLDLKDSDGAVTYRSPQASVAEYGTQSEDAADLSSRIEEARSAGYGVIARIWCFEDHTAPSGCYEGAVKYGSADGVLWLDDSA
ncbi:MAG TPA: putative glycoside hydrolase, partial [Oscillospiraceae bacterium]|nr:putative glycoside hydrolase [Oscillospiraceae bacterium]